jgi:transposase
VAQLWAFDEHRLGLKPILRRTWTLKGTRPKALVNHRYQWLYLYAFLHPQSGKVHWLILPRVDVEILNLALADFARSQGAGKGKQVVLVMDRAGWHRSDRVVVPNGIHVVLLPPYSPELQPAERLWPLSNEAVANKSFKDLDELEQTQAYRCLILKSKPELIRSHTLFYWWPLT